MLDIAPLAGVKAIQFYPIFQLKMKAYATPVPRATIVSSWKFSTPANSVEIIINLAVCTHNGLVGVDPGDDGL